MKWDQILLNIYWMIFLNLYWKKLRVEAHPPYQSLSGPTVQVPPGKLQKLGELLQKMGEELKYSVLT